VCPCCPSIAASLLPRQEQRQCEPSRARCLCYASLSEEAYENYCTSCGRCKESPRSDAYFFFIRHCYLGFPLLNLRTTVAFFAAQIAWNGLGNLMELT
jgi:hypothetical protein